MHITYNRCFKHLRTFLFLLIGFSFPLLSAWGSKIVWFYYMFQKVWNSEVSEARNFLENCWLVWNVCAFHGGNFDDLVNIPTMIGTVVVYYWHFSFHWLCKKVRSLGMKSTTKSIKLISNWELKLQSFSAAIWNLCRTLRSSVYLGSFHSPKIVKIQTL